MNAQEFLERAGALLLAHEARHNLLLGIAANVSDLAELARTIDVELSGVTGAVPEVADFAALWGRPAELTRSDNIWELRELRPPPATAGRPREATRDDLPLLLDWFAWFQVDERLVRRQVEQRLSSDDGGVTLWEVEGEPVSMCGYGSPTPNGIRIGAVYTPPEHRGRGYAAAVTGEVSRRQLERGRFCFLYTDATNATAEGVYARLGYTRVAESRQLAFA